MMLWKRKNWENSQEMQVLGWLALWDIWQAAVHVSDLAEISLQSSARWQVWRCSDGCPEPEVEQAVASVTFQYPGSSFCALL